MSFINQYSKQNYVSVSKINKYIKSKLYKDRDLRNIYVKGEVSNFRVSHNGHYYFTLKDEDSKIKAVIFKRSTGSLKFKIEDGMKVLVKGRINLYEAAGEYSINVQRISQDGLGDLYVAFEQLKKKLLKEGLFDDSYKKEIPKFPKRIGVVTAPTGAAIRDIITTIKRRWPLCEVILFPSLVQGDDASENIVSQIEASENYNLDTLIIGRGGGSIEDLWTFNEEIVARAIFNCSIPIISAVGHEVDYTIADFVADLRAPTPTAAAELAAPKLSEIKNKLSRLKRQSNKHIKLIFANYKSKFDNTINKSVLKNPKSYYLEKEMRLDELLMKLEFESKSLISSNKSKLFELKSSIGLKNPYLIINSKIKDFDDLIFRLDYESKSLISSNENKLFSLKSSIGLRNPYLIVNSKKRRFDDLIVRLNYESKSLISSNRNKLFELKNSYLIRNPSVLINDKSKDYSKTKLILDNKFETLLNKKENDFRKFKENHLLNNPQILLDKKSNQLAVNFDKLEVLNPLNTLKRGYSLTKVNGKVVSSSKKLKKGDKLEVKFKDGSVDTEVI